MGILLLPQSLYVFRGARSSTEGEGASHIGLGHIRHQDDSHHCLFKQARDKLRILIDIQIRKVTIKDTRKVLE